MARSNDRSGKGKNSARSPISDRQKRLDEERSRIEEEEARIKRMLADAPKKREELQKKQRDEFIKRKTKVVQIDRPVDTRFDAITVTRSQRGRRNRHERTFGQVLFVFLLIGFVLSLYYAFRVMGSK